MTERCQHCNAVLAHRPRATTISEYGTVRHHYRCLAEDCPADAGAIVTSDGEVTRRVGPAVDPRHGRSVGTQATGAAEAATDGGVYKHEEVADD